MTNKEIIYNALGIIEGLACVSQRNMRDTFIKAVDMIRRAIEESVVVEGNDNAKEESCEHNWELKETRINPVYGMYDCKYICSKCGKEKMIMCE